MAGQRGYNLMATEVRKARVVQVKVGCLSTTSFIVGSVGPFAFVWHFSPFSQGEVHILSSWENAGAQL